MSLPLPTSRGQLPSFGCGPFLHLQSQRWGIFKTVRDPEILPTSSTFERLNTKVFMFGSPTVQADLILRTGG